jgi:hypothetical protein
MTPPVPDDRGCLEGETLAAWHEGTLTASDVEAVDRHLADCARCQDLLAAFVRTDVAVAAPDPVGDSLWRRWRLAWLVPVATAATATAIWVAIPDRASVTRPPTSASDRAATSEPQARAAPGERGVARQQAETDVPEAGAEDPGAALERAAAGPPSRAERAAPAAPAEAPADTAASSVPSSADRDAELRRRPELEILPLCLQRSYHFPCLVDPTKIPRDPPSLINPRCAKILPSYMQYFSSRINSFFCLSEELNPGKYLSISKVHENLWRYSL